MSNNVGRKENEKVSTNEMLMYIIKYTKEFPNERVNIKKLSEFSGIDRHYWYSRKGVKEEIERVNALQYPEYECYISEVDRKLLKLPDVDSLVDNNYKSKKNLKKVLQTYFNIIQEFYDSACQTNKLKKDLAIITLKYEKNQQEISQLKESNKKYKELYKYYENLYYSRAILSEGKIYRDENNIKSKIININANKKLMYSTNENDLNSLLNEIED